VGTKRDFACKFRLGHCRFSNQRVISSISAVFVRAPASEAGILAHFEESSRGFNRVRSEFGRVQSTADQWRFELLSFRDRADRSLILPPADKYPPSKNLHWVSAIMTNRSLNARSRPQHPPPPISTTAPRCHVSYTLPCISHQAGCLGSALWRQQISAICAKTSHATCGDISLRVGDACASKLTSLKATSLKATTLQSSEGQFVRIVVIS